MWLFYYLLAVAVRPTDSQCKISSLRFFLSSSPLMALCDDDAAAAAAADNNVVNAVTRIMSSV